VPSIEAVRQALTDRYTLESLIGEGGMATVWRARDLKHGRDVALKILRDELAAAVGAQRFLREVRVTARLQHPHVLALFDSGEVEGTPWYAMPLIHGETLRARLQRERQLSVEEAVQLTRQVAAALAHAHARGVIHRDVKPENILLQDGHAYVADFGVALAVAQVDDGRLTDTGMAVGTLTYMSPEQATGERGVDGRSDQFALGAMAYEMLVGEPPHRGATLQALVARIVLTPPTPLHTMRPGLPPALEVAILRSLAKVPADRFPSVEAFSAALGTALPTPAATPVPAGAPDARVATVSRRWALVGVLAAGIVFAVRVFTRERATAPVPTSGQIVLAVLPCEDRTKDAALAYIADGLSENLVNRLTHVRGLQVIPRGIVRTASGAGGDAMATAERLQATHVVTCNVSRAGRDVRMGAQLVQVAPPRELWGDGGTAPAEGLLAIEDSLLAHVVASLPVAVSPEERTALAQGDTRDGEAQRLFLLGRHLQHRFTGRDLGAALGYYEQAIARDSTFARAYAGIAAAHIVSAIGIGRERSDVAFPKARAALARGLSFRPDDADLLAIRAMVRLWADRDLAGARADAARALASDAGNAIVHQTWQHVLMGAGQVDSALAEGLAALRQDPSYPRLYTDRVVYLYMAGRFAEAEQVQAEALTLDAASVTALTLDAYLAAARGQQAEARAALERLSARDGGAPFARTDRAVVLAMLGDRTAARALADTLAREARDRAEPALLGAVYGLLGEGDRAFQWLDRAERDGSRWLLTIPVDPRFDALRRDPRYAPFLARVRAGHGS
jgi:eukaryotic-like serine/threonine-protein kinase